MVFTPRVRTRACLPPRSTPAEAPAQKPSGCPFPTVTATHRPGRSAWNATARQFALAAITGAADALTTLLLHLLHLASS
ncbi:hypothetical protein AQJ30_23655 [Streptomyces longwoodensis]|uniref:Uncharacterized protein n=1 Tax=Streptomyces longwoodensis TaxID=68231 RepID=A0A117QLZ8_9ACTN|nr:hypothetical protein AQJ30_23655 [Streptomyces longwoodensis]